MIISSDHHNEAMIKFLISRYERVVGVNVVGNEPYQYDRTLERIQTHDSYFFG